MPEIRENSDIVTQITTVKVPPNNQSEVLELMAHRARFMATQPRFRIGQPAPQRGRQSRRELCAMEESQAARGCASFTRVPQEMAALWRIDQRSGAMPL
jgi:hypothetical protein